MHRSPGRAAAAVAVLAVVIGLAGCTTVQTPQAPVPGERATVYVVGMAPALGAIADTLRPLRGVSEVTPRKDHVRFVYEGFDGQVRLRCVSDAQGQGAGYWPSLRLEGERRWLAPRALVRLLGFHGALPGRIRDSLGALGTSRQLASPVLAGDGACEHLRAEAGSAGS